MKIGVLGVGAIGGTVAKKLAAAGHDVKVANSRGREAVADFAAEIGAEASDLEGVTEGVDALVLSIPCSKLHGKQPASVTPTQLANDNRARIATRMRGR